MTAIKRIVNIPPAREVFRIDVIANLDEAVLVEGLLPQSMRTLAATLPEHAWFWDGVEHVDPAKEATAQATRLANHTTTLAAEYARQGRDWEQELRQRAKERALMDELGLTRVDLLKLNIEGFRRVQAWTDGQPERYTSYITGDIGSQPATLSEAGV